MFETESPLLAWQQQSSTVCRLVCWSEKGEGKCLRLIKIHFFRTKHPIMDHTALNQALHTG